MEVDALGRVLVKLADGRVRRLQKLPRVVGELGKVIAEVGRAVEGRISEGGVGRRTLSGHGREMTTPWVVLSQTPQTGAPDACRAFPGSWVNWLK